MLSSQGSCETGRSCLVRLATVDEVSVSETDEKVKVATRRRSGSQMLRLVVPVPMNINPLSAYEHLTAAECVKKRLISIRAVERLQTPKVLV